MVRPERSISLRSIDDFYFSSRISELESDLELQIAQQNEKRNATQFLLDRFDELIESADHSLNSLLEHDKRELGEAIVRLFHDLADAVGSIVTQIDNQSEEERSAFSQAITDDFQHALQLYDECGVQDEEIVASSSEISRAQISSMFQVIVTLLRDVESTLRIVDQRDAEELADAALTLAHMFLLNLQSIHERIATDFSTFETIRPPDMSFEVIEEADDGKSPLERVDQRFTDRSSSRSGTTRLVKNESKIRSTRMKRIRILWPPLSPILTSACVNGRDALTQSPLLAVTLGTTFWPAVALVAIIGTPIVIADSVLQNMYRNFENDPVLQGLEQGAAQLYQGARLSLLCGKLVGHQTLCVASRQIERQGGLANTASSIAVAVVDRVTHPLQTIGMTWNSLTWGWNTVRETMIHLSDCSEERNEPIVHLQQ